MKLIYEPEIEPIAFKGCFKTIFSQQLLYFTESLKNTARTIHLCAEVYEALDAKNYSKWMLYQSCKSGRAFRVGFGFGPNFDKNFGHIRAVYDACKYILLKREYLVLFFYSVQNKQFWKVVNFKICSKKQLNK